MSELLIGSDKHTVNFYMIFLDIDYLKYGQTFISCYSSTSEIKSDFRILIFNEIL
mgnify:CR=1 FL=1